MGNKMYRIEKGIKRYILYSRLFLVSLVVCVALVFGSVDIIIAAPAITEYWNNQTRDTLLMFNLELWKLVVFYVEADQDIDNWYWYINGEEQTLPTQQYGPVHPKDCSFRMWPEKENTTYIIKVNGSNAEGTTNSITWTIYVPSQSGGFSGKVLDISSNPLNEVTITDGTHTTITNSNGNYSFTNLAEGSYAFTVHKDGYVWETKQVEIVANQTITHDFQLPEFTAATVIYNGTNIEITNGDATISTISGEIKDTSVLEEISPKVWLLKKNIGGSNASLYINGDDCEELRLLSMNDGSEVLINDPTLLHVFNTKIVSWNISNNAPAPDTDDKRAMIKLEGNEKKGIFVNSYLGYLEFTLLPGEFFFMENCTVEHTDGLQISRAYHPEWASVRHCQIIETIGVVGTDACLSTGINNFVSDKNVVSSQDHMVVALAGDNAIIKNNVCLYTPSGSGLGVGRGGGLGGLNQLIIDSISMNIEHNGIDVGGYDGEPLLNVTLKNNEVFATYDNGYYVTTWDYVTPSVQNPVIEDCVAHEIRSRPLCVDPGINVTIRRFKSWNSHAGINIQDAVNQGSRNVYIIDSDIEVLEPETDYTLYITKTQNVNVINIKRNNNRTWIENSDVNFCYYLDVLVHDKNENPVKDAVVSVDHPNVIIDWYGDGSEYKEIEVKSVNMHVIAREFTEGLLAPQYIAKTITGVNGHTPLPLDFDNTLVIADYRLDRHGSPWYQHALQTTEFNNWSITAEKNGVSVTVNEINPDENWYRSNPNLYPGDGKGTIIITLPITIETDVSTDKILVYPNPYVKRESSEEKITFANLHQEATIRIYTVSGELVKIIEHKDTADGGSEEWDVSGISSGIYLYTVISSEGTKKGKVSIIK